MRFLEKKVDISKIKRAFVLKNLFSGTAYVFVVRTKFQVSSLILTSFKQRGGRRKGERHNFTTAPTSKRTPKKHTHIMVNQISKNLCLGSSRKELLQTFFGSTFLIIFKYHWVFTFPSLDSLAEVINSVSLAVSFNYFLQLLPYLIIHR